MIFSFPGLFGDYFNLKSLKPSFKGHMVPLKVKCRFVAFFAMVPSSLFEIITYVLRRASLLAVAKSIY